MRSYMGLHLILHVHQTRNPRGFSKVGETKLLLLAIVGRRYFLSQVQLPRNSELVDYPSKSLAKSIIICWHCYFTIFR